MKHMLQICCKNNNISKEFPIGSSLLDIYYGFNLNFPYQVVSAKVNNRSEGLNFRVYNNKDVEFLDIRDSSGMRTYVRSLCFILYKAVSELFPEGKLFVEHPVSKGYFCNLRIGRSIELEDVTAIKKRMQEIIAENIAALIDSVVKARPASAKGAYIESVTVSCAMCPGLPVDTASIAKL